MKMDIGTVLLGALIGGVALFFWMGFTQNVLPWGIRSVGQHPDNDQLAQQLSATVSEGMFLVHTPQAATAFIALRRGSYYHMGRYFAVEFVTQLAVGAVLAALLALTLHLPLEQRLLSVGLAALGAAFSIDLQYWNWWGFSLRYSLGIAVNRIVGWLLVGGMLAVAIIR
jgi:hypothetical protein